MPEKGGERREEGGRRREEEVAPSIQLSIVCW